MRTTKSNKYILVILSCKKLTFGNNSLINGTGDDMSSTTHSLISNQVQSESGPCKNSRLILIQILMELD